MKILYALIYGAFAFLMVSIGIFVESYVKCLVTGIDYRFFLVVPIAIKVGAVVGVAVTVLTFIGSPRSRQ